MAALELRKLLVIFFFFNDPATPEIYPLSLPGALPIFRRPGGIGYPIGWGRNWSFFIVASFLAFACIAIPLGTGMPFIQWGPRWREWESLPLTALAILDRKSVV